MLELGEEVVDVPGHAEAAAPVQVVPLDVNASQFVTSQIELDAMKFLEKVHEVVEVLDADVFDTKVVDNETELEGTPFVAPEARCGGCFVKPFCRQTRAE